MTKQSPSNKQRIADLLNQNELLIKSDLVHLSNLNNEELAFLEQTWQKADVKRRRKIISDLVQFSRVDFRLDFGSIFVFCLKDSDSIVRVHAIAGLEQEEDYRHIPLLVHILEKDSSAKVREAAVSALGKFAMLGELGKLSNHNINAVYSILMEILENDTESIRLRSQALEAIAPLNMPRIKQLIEKAYQSDDILLKISAIRAMGINSQSFWLDNILKEMDSSQFEVRYAAICACGELGIEDAFPYILKLLETEDTTIQEAAIRALGEIGGEEAQQALNILKKNPKERLRHAAKTALKELEICEDPLSFGF
jgi:HEAT repeat protein